MENMILPAKYPTSIIAIDDDQNMVDSIQLNLGCDYNVFTYTNPSCAMKELESNVKNHKSILKKCMLSRDDETDDAEVISRIDIKKMFENVYDNERFSKITIAIVDYSMPTMSGEEVGRMIKAIDEDVKIILLTGEANDSTAIRLFNEGVIDAFVAKQDSDMEYHLRQKIEKLFDDYFYDLFSSLIKASRDGLKILNDKECFTYFQEIVKKNNIVEYYMLDRKNTFVMMNASGDVSWIVMQTKSDIDDVVDIYKDCDDYDEQTMRALKDREKVVLMLDEFMAGEFEWGRVLYDADSINAQDGAIYASYIVNTKTVELPNRDNIISYSEYLETEKQ